MIPQQQNPIKSCLVLCSILLPIIALLKAITEAMSDNKELSRVFHHTISSDLKAIASALCIASDLLDIYNPHEYADVCY